LANGLGILPEVSERPTALLTVSMTVILSTIEGWKDKERGKRGRKAWLAIPARLRFLLGRYWSHDTESHDSLPSSETGLVRTLRVQRVFGMPPQLHQIVSLFSRSGFLLRAMHRVPKDS
jgi:hypothetical protein